MKRLWLGGALVAASLLIACSSSTGGNSADSGSDATIVAPSDDGGGTADTGTQCATPLCAGNCCTAGSICISDSAGNKSCAVACTHSSECAAPTNCCAMLGDAGAGGVCAPSQLGGCLCETVADCANLGVSCAPYAVNDVSSSVYVCKPQDSQPWDGCFNPSNTCPTGYSCWRDHKGNTFCARSCITSATCGNPGNACCYGTDAGAGCANYNTSCGGPGGCMPCE